MSTITFARFGRESINKDHVKFIRLVLLNLTNNMIMNLTDTTNIGAFDRNHETYVKELIVGRDLIKENLLKLKKEGH